MKIALASPPLPGSLEEGLLLLDAFVREAALKKAAIVCFPESFLPGYPGMGYAARDRSPEALAGALERARIIARIHELAIILPMDAYLDGRLVNLAYVIDRDGQVPGFQTKNQLDPSEDGLWTPGTERRLFELAGLKFGITICHEGFRYPESVRWAACQGAALVFHPHCNGSNVQGTRYMTFMGRENPYYEKAMMLRALENGIFFAGVNYASRFQESASALFAPDGSCLGYQPYGEAGVYVIDIEPDKASRIYARRFRPDLYKY